MDPPGWSGVDLFHLFCYICPLNLSAMPEKVGVYFAHDDDLLLRVLERVMKHKFDGDDVYAVLFTDGENSHTRALGIHENPTPEEVKRARAEEFKCALEVAGLTRDRIHTLGLSDGDGNIWGKDPEVMGKVMGITAGEKPTIMYYHNADPHVDHRGVCDVMSTIVGLVQSVREAYKFVVWTKELAEGRTDVDASAISEVSQDAIRIPSVPFLAGFKQRALFQMRSQVQVWPYPHWQVQNRPNLTKEFIDRCVGTDEIFIPVRLMG